MTTPDPAAPAAPAPVTSELDVVTGDKALLAARAAKKDDKKPYGDVAYADPGYQKDGKKRYPIDTAEHVKAAWSYINKKENADKYSSEDLAKVRARIKAAALKFNIKIEDDSSND